MGKKFADLTQVFKYKYMTLVQLETLPIRRLLIVVRHDRLLIGIIEKLMTGFGNELGTICSLQEKPW